MDSDAPPSPFELYFTSSKGNPNSKPSPSPLFSSDIGTPQNHPTSTTEFILSGRNLETPMSTQSTLLSIEEQEILSQVQDIQYQLQQLRAEEEEEEEGLALEGQEEGKKRKGTLRVVQGLTTSPNSLPSNLQSPQPLTVLPKQEPIVEPRLFIVSKTLPIHIERNTRNPLKWKIKKTTSGLDKLMCLSSFQKAYQSNNKHSPHHRPVHTPNNVPEQSMVWIGTLAVPSHVIAVSERETIRRLLLSKYQCIPVFLDEPELFNDFTSQVLWPLFHYIAEPITISSSGSRPANHRFHSKRQWSAYVEANLAFVQVLKQFAKPHDQIWIHDYHLMLVPSQLRPLSLDDNTQKKISDPPSLSPNHPHPNNPNFLDECSIGWFLHTPFPSSEVFRRLPERQELLKGLLGADLVGFQTYEYARHFLSTCQLLLLKNDVPMGTFFSPRGVQVTTRHLMYLGVFPIGVDVEHFQVAVKSVKCKTKVEELRKTFAHQRVIVGIDRIDFIKGIGHKLLAFEQLLIRHPEYIHQRVILIQIGISLRSNVSNSSQTFAQINHLVGRINGQFGTFDYTPVHFIHQTTSSSSSIGGNLVGLDTAEICAVYRLAQVCFVSSIRDGMNLVGHEFCVCQEESQPEEEHNDGDNEESSYGPGVLVLSEFTGSATSLNGALLINPWNPEEGCQALHQALSMTKVERTLRAQKLVRVIRGNTASDWATTFLSDLSERRKLNGAAKARSGTAPSLCPEETFREYSAATNRVIIADLDGMFTIPLHQALPDLATTSAFLKQTLELLSQDQHNTVFLVSGRERKFLEVVFGGPKKQNHNNRVSQPSPKVSDKTLPHTGLGSGFLEHPETNGSLSKDSHKNVFKPSQIGIAAEDGLFYRLSSDEDWNTMTRDDPDPFVSQSSWKDQVLQTMQRFTERTPGSVIESKEGSLTWHYHNSDVHFGNWQAKDLQSTLERELMGTPLDVIQGNRLLVVQHEGFGKSTIVEALLKYLSLPEQVHQRGEIDFIFCVGDGASDEQMFQSLEHIIEAAMDQPPSVVGNLSPVVEEDNFQSRTLDGLDFESIRMSRQTRLYTVQVGSSALLSSAKYSLTSLAQFRRILKGFSDISRELS